MASLLDYLNQGQAGGVLGGSGYNLQGTPDTTLAQILQGSASGNPLSTLFRLSSGIAGNSTPPMAGQAPVQQDPFNTVMPNGPNAPQPMPTWPDNPLASQPAAAAPPMPPPQNVGPPPGAMPVSLPAQQPPQQAPAVAPAAQPPSFMGGLQKAMGGLNNYIDNNRATLMGLAGGIANQGMGGFATAAPIAMQERQWQQQQQNQALTANAIHQGLIAKGHDPREATAIAMASAGNPAVAQAVLPELFSNKASGEFSFGSTKIPYKLENGKVKLLLPGEGPKSLTDLINFSQGIEAQGAATKTAAVKTAEAQAAAKQQLPDTLAKTDETLRNIETLRNHPGKGAATGFVAGAVPALGGAQADYIGRLNQLKGEAVQQAMSEMRGSGVRFTQREIDSLQSAQARLDRRGDVDAALNDMERVLKGARERAGVKAGIGPTPAPAAADPLGIR